MFGRNPTRGQVFDDGTSLTLQGLPWATIQGEGPYAGSPATFIRLWGCNLKCYFCDTDFESAPVSRTVKEVVEMCDAQR